ncbi:MAG: cadherin-like domain-containing protein [Saprospirales bacterium]|nr:cadherin-like domain-containing protein [Saprospirales bacterium]
MDQLDPKDSTSIRKWAELEALIYTDWFTDFVSESAQAEIIKKLGEKFTSFLNAQLDELNPADTSMLEKWQQIEVLIHTDWFTTYVSKADQETIIEKLKEKFTQYLKTRADSLDPTDEDMLEDWVKLETLTKSDWFSTYVSEADRAVIIKKLKEKFTAWLKDRLDKLDPKDPNFLEKWIKLQKLTLSDWFDEYVDKPQKAESDMAKDYQQWDKAHTTQVDYSKVNWEEVQWTGDRIKSLFAGPLPGAIDKTGLRPITWVIIAGVPIATGVIIYVATRPDPPAATPDVLTIACPGEGTVNVLANDTGKDLRIISTSQSPYASITDLGGGNLQVQLFLTTPITQFTFSYTIEDKKGRTATADVQVNIVLPQILAVDDDFEGYTGAPFAGNPLINDEGEGLVIISNTIPAGGTFNMGFDGTFTFIPDEGFCENTSFTYVVTDDCGQTATANVSLTILDNEAPEITCPPDMTISCEEPTDPGATGQATVTDNCTANPPTTYVDKYTGVPCNQTLTRTWTATDEAGFTASCDQLILIVDETAPTITCPPNTTIPCEDTPDPMVTGAPEFADNCTLPEDLVLTYEDNFTGSGGSGDMERTWMVVDQCGNASSCVQVISLEDTEAPTITCPPDIQLSCELPPDPGNTGFPEAADNCAAIGEIDIQYEDQLIGSGCLPDILRTWTAKDGAGNTASCEHLIVIEDVTPPVIVCPPNITVDCGQELDLSVTGSAMGIDECGAVTVVYNDDLSGLNGCSGIILRNWVAFDACGNASFCVQTIELTPVDCAFGPNPVLFPSSCGQPNGEILLNIVPPGEYSFTWSDGSTGPGISNLFSGLYEVTITDNLNFCTEILQLFLPEEPPIFVLNTTVDPDICILPGNITLLLNGSGSGFFDILVSGPNSFTVPLSCPGR